MAKARISDELIKFFRELPTAHTHLKVVVILSILIHAGIVFGISRSGLTDGKLPLAYVLVVTGLVIGSLWLLGFALGHMCHKKSFVPCFPPVDQLFMGAIPSLAAGIVVGTVIGHFGFRVSVLASIAFSLIAWCIVIIVSVVLGILHKPITIIAYQAAQNPGILIADSYRAMLLFPALGTLLVGLVFLVLEGDSGHPLGVIAVTSALATSVTLAGLSSGYLD